MLPCKIYIIHSTTQSISDSSLIFDYHLIRRCRSRCPSVAGKIVYSMRHQINREERLLDDSRCVPSAPTAVSCWKGSSDILRVEALRQCSSKGRRPCSLSIWPCRTRFLFIEAIPFAFLSPFASYSQKITPHIHNESPFTAALKYGRLL